MRTSAKGIALIKSFESLSLKAYRCPAGILTIGWGHTDGVREGDTCTGQEAEDMLKDDLHAAETAVNAIPADLPQNRFDALVSFAFNVGASALMKSTLCRKVTADPDDPSIRDEFMRWVNSGGKTLPGLARRRRAEADMYFGK